MMLMVAAGFGVDYSRAVQIRSTINAAADAASLVSVDPTMFNKSDAEAEATARALFNSRIAQLPGVTLTSLTVTAPTTSSNVVAANRTATVTWTATVTNSFSGILGRTTTTISGTSEANAAVPPSINFCVMLDNSPSMLLPTTSAGIDALEDKSNCAFSCHIDEGTAVKDSAGRSIILARDYYSHGLTQDAGVYRYAPSTQKVYDANGVEIGNTATVGSGSSTLKYKNTGGSWVTLDTVPGDPFWLAQNFGKAHGSPARIRMRIDDELAAAQELISTARNTQSALSSGTTVQYKMQFFTMNYEAYPLTGAMDLVSNVQASDLVPASGTLAPYMLKNTYFPTNSDPTTAPGTYTNNSDSAPYASLMQMNALMPTPGTGSANSTPQQVLIIVTDGYQDEMIGGSQIRQAWNTQALAQCTAIKSRGISIAILYTTYDPATISQHYTGYAAKTPQIAPALRSCASTTPGGTNLMYTVSVDEDITDALNALFAMTVKSARLTK